MITWTERKKKLQSGERHRPGQCIKVNENFITKIGIGRTKIETFYKN